jgi:RNA polymerase sigma factor (sigma-70 family)
MITVLDLLAGHHKEWIKMVHKFGAGSYAEDIVQEMYIRLNKYVENPERIMYKNQPNKLFVWVTLRNMTRQFQNKKDLMVYTGDMVEYDIAEEEFDRVQAEGFEKLIDKVWEVMEDLHWYDQKMFEVYHKTDMSMRDIEKETGISLFSIFDTLKNSKEYVQEKINEDYEDYQNGESERI